MIDNLSTVQLTWKNVLLVVMTVNTLTMKTTEVKTYRSMRVVSRDVPDPNNLVVAPGDDDAAHARVELRTVHKARVRQQSLTAVTKLFNTPHSVNSNKQRKNSHILRNTEY